MLIDDKQVAIVGGGPAGLTLARLLQQKGATVKVFERDHDRDARLIGSPLDLHEQSGLAAIRKANLLNEFKKNFRSGGDRKTIVNERADIFFSTPEPKTADDFDDKYFRPEIDRHPLRNLLLESLTSDTVVWDSHFISMKSQNAGWLLQFKNGNSFYADLVIAADGANSKIRPYVTDIKSFYTGITMIEGNIADAKNAIPQIYALLNEGALMAFGNTKNIFMGLKGSGDLTFYLSFKTDNDKAADNALDYSSKAEMMKWFRKEYFEWSNIWDQLFEQSTPPFVPRQIYCIPLEQSWVTLPNVTMIGDAAHVMPPSAGEGANMAMLDALELSECLTSGNYTTLKEAISNYETTMRERAATAAKLSLENGERMHSEGALEKMLRLFNSGRFSE